MRPLTTLGALLLVLAIACALASQRAKLSVLAVLVAALNEANSERTTLWLVASGLVLIFLDAAIRGARPPT